MWLLYLRISSSSFLSFILKDKDKHNGFENLHLERKKEPVNLFVVAVIGLIFFSNCSSKLSSSEGQL